MKGLFRNIHHPVSIKSEVIDLLHDLMYQPQGNINLCKLKQKHSHRLVHDLRYVLAYCTQKSFIILDNESAQLTDVGLDYYLKNMKEFSYL